MTSLTDHSWLLILTKRIISNNENLLNVINILPKWIQNLVKYKINHHKNGQMCIKVLSNWRNFGSVTLKKLRPMNSCRRFNTIKIFSRSELEAALADPVKGPRILGLHFVGQRISADDVRIHRPQNDFKVNNYLQLHSHSRARSYEKNFGVKLRDDIFKHSNWLFNIFRPIGVLKTWLALNYATISL